MKKELTKELIKQSGITDVVWNETEQNWDVYVNGKEVPVKHIVQVTKHKYGKSMVYEMIHRTWVDDDGRLNQLRNTVDSIAYVWHKGTRPIGWDVDHIDSNTMNHRLDNLQCITHKENLAKRTAKNNQWSIISKALGLNS